MGNQVKNEAAAAWLRGAEALIAQRRAETPPGPAPHQPMDQMAIALEAWRANLEAWQISIEQDAAALRTRCPRAVTPAQRASVERRLVLLAEDGEKGLDQALNSNPDIQWLAIEYASTSASDERLSAIKASEAARDRIAARQGLLAQKPDVLTVDETEPETCPITTLD